MPPPELLYYATITGYYRSLSWWKDINIAKFKSLLTVFMIHNGDEVAWSRMTKEMRRILAVGRVPYAITPTIFSSDQNTSNKKKKHNSFALRLSLRFGSLKRFDCRV
ncbi:hypothetical protein Q3G72_020585 [Acer saccharum]|nr:hypothetical protein Q3G72_020585 [Acer saccharum]